MMAKEMEATRRPADVAGEPELRRVLIVDDDRDFADSMAALLRPRGYELRTASTVEDALVAAREFPVQAALLDIRLGTDNGLSLIEQLNILCPRIHCLMATAYADLETAIEAVKRGAYDYLRKPISPYDLFAALDRCFDRLALEEQNLFLANQLVQAQKLESIGRLASGVAHDFNNVLTAVLAGVELSLNALQSLTSGPNQVEEGLKQIERSAQHAAALTHQLLTFSRKRASQLASVDLNEVLNDMERLLRRLLREQIELKFDLSPRIVRFRADRGLVEQVVMNLVVNAQDAMPDGGTLRIATSVENLDVPDSNRHTEGDSGERVVLTLSDTGSGMDAETLQRIFDPFFTTKDVGKGTGLGLAMVYGTIQQLGGYVNVNSEQGTGTTFRICIPAERTALETSKSSRDEHKPKGGNGETILICEDDNAIRDLMKQVLEANGYNVVSAENGRSALALAADHEGKIAALVTDFSMPGINGIALAEELCRKHTDLKVILASGYTGEIGRLPKPFDMSILEKPYTPTKLLSKLQEILS